MKSLLCILATLLFSQSMMAQWETFKRRPCGTAILLQQNKALTRAISTSPNYVKHEGKVTIPVVLVNFSDVKFTINSPKAAFDQFFNGNKYDADQFDYGNGNQFNHSSVAQYFKDMSGNEFQPVFKVYGPVTLSNKQQYYGGTNDSGSDEKASQLVIDALAAIKDSVTDDDINTFSLDSSTIEAVYIVYAGLGQNEGGPATNVWAKTWSLNASLGGKTVRWYTMSGELSPFKLTSSGTLSIKSGTTPLIDGIGVACHEFSHAMGLPDLYPYSNSNAHVNNQEMEYWDLMDGGEYSGVITLGGKSYYPTGGFPTAYTAFEKEQMGWPVTIEELTGNANIRMTDSTEKGGTAYKIVNPDNPLEYLMLECIQHDGWNKYQFGKGLLVYHVNLPNSYIDLGTDLNDSTGFPGMAVVPADSACLSSYITETSPYFSSLWGDLFPGTGSANSGGLNVTELSDAIPKPNFCWYNSAKTKKLPTNKALKNITYTSPGVVTFDYVSDVASGILPVWNNETGDRKIYSVDGRYLGTDLNALPHGVYIVGGRKILK